MRRGLLIATLTAVGATTDAISYLGLHQVFPANMTGNTVLIAVHTAKHEYASTARSSIALGGFVLGAALAGAVVATRSPASVWRRTRPVLAVELAALLTTLIWWLVAGSPSGHARQFVSIGLLGLAMGAQSGVVAQADLAVSTTYITGTWTAISTYVGRAIGRRPARTDSDGPRAAAPALVLGAYLVAAFGAAYLFNAVRGPALALPCAALIAALGLTSGRRGAEPT